MAVPRLNARNRQGGQERAEGLCDALAMIGRRDEAVSRFEKLLAMCNDVVG